MSEIVEAVFHGVLEGGSIIFETKGHDSVGEFCTCGNIKRLSTSHLYVVLVSVIER